MKLLSLIASLLVSTAIAQKCDPKTLRAEFYTDAKCATLDAKMTKRHGKIAKYAEKFFSGECVQGPSFVGILTCPDSQYTAKVWKDESCEGEPFETITFKWETCTKYNNSYVKLYK